MLNLKNIKKHGDIITASVEPWIAKDRSFTIKVNVKKREITGCSLDKNTTEVEIYAGKARYKLCSLYEEAIRSGTEIPEYSNVVTH